MIWFILGFKNMIRRRTRSILTVLGVAIAIAVLYSLFQFQQGYQARLKDELGAMGAQVMVVPKGCPYEAATIALHGGKWPRYMDEGLLDKVKANPGVAEAAGVIMDAITTDDGKNMIFLGIDPDYMRFRPAWKIAGQGTRSGSAAALRPTSELGQEEGRSCAGTVPVMSPFDSDSGVILGSSVAEELGLKPGDRFTIPGKEKVSKLTGLHVAGVLHRTNTQDDGFTFLSRKTLQRLFDLPGKLVVILIKAKQVDRTDELVASLRAAEVDMNVLPLSELLSTIGQLMASTRVFVSAILIIAIIIGGMGVLNTVLMAVFERTREIGMMKAMGASAGDAFKLVWAETILITLAGGIVGVVIAVASSRLVETLIRGMIPFAPRGSLIGLSLPTLIGCTLLSLILGLVAGFYPALRASSVKPVEAIKAE
jgi:putative ABC transport system permease protein